MPDHESVTVDAARAGTRLDKLLADLPSVGTRERARQALHTGKVRVDGEPVGQDDAGRRLDEGATVLLAWSQPGTAAKKVAHRDAAIRAGVRVVASDDAIVVADKPAGLLTDAADPTQERDHDTLRKRLRAMFGSKVAPAHRIDRNTTGLVLFARTPEALTALKEQFYARTPERVYLALVEGHVKGDRGRWADWMAWDGKQKVQEPCEATAEGAFRAEASWVVRERLRNATLLEVRLVSGRRNQIRLQAMLAGHPLVGEAVYRQRGPTPIPFGRQALHAHRLGIVHPSTGQPITWTSPLPRDLVALIGTLR